MVRHQRDQRRGQLRQVPDRDSGLIGIGIPATAINRAEDLGRVVGIHKGAGAVIDRLAADGHVVGVHHAVDKAEAHPLCDELRLRGDNAAEQGRNAVRIRVVARDDVIRQRLERGDVLPRGMHLKAADADMAAGHAGQDSAGQGGLSHDVLSGCDGGEGAGGGHAHGGHRL